MIKRRICTKENINKIIDLYKNKKYRIIDIHNETGFSETTIRRILVEYCNFSVRRKNKITDELEKQICIEYQNGLTPIEISDKYGFHPKTIRNKLTKNGFKLKKGPNNLFNEYYFDVIDTEEKAYFLGYLMADGNISIYNLLGKKESKILYDYMYSNATFYLKRKKDRMDIIIKTTPRKSK